MRFFTPPFCEVIEGDCSIMDYIITYAGQIALLVLVIGVPIFLIWLIFKFKKIQ